MPRSRGALFPGRSARRSGDLAGGHRSPFETSPVRTRGLRRPKQDSQVRISQAFLDFRNEILTKFDIDLAQPRLDLLSFELGGERLDELLVFCAVGKKDFHPVAKSASIYRYATLGKGIALTIVIIEKEENGYSH